MKEVDFLPEKAEYTIGETVVLNETEILITGRQETYLFNVNTWKTTYAKEIFGGQKLENVRVLFDNKENLWLYNKSGYIWQYIPSKNEFKSHFLIPPSVLSIIDLERYSVWVDSRGVSWVSTYGNGLFAIRSDTDTLTHFSRSNSGLKTNYLLSIYEDKAGEIWVGTEYTGITKILATNYETKVFNPNPHEGEIEDKIIRSIFQDKENNIWLGTKNGNLYVYDSTLSQLKKTIQLQRGIPNCIIEDGMENVWIGTKGYGLVHYSKKNNKIETYLHRTTDTTSLVSNNVFSILIDSVENAWVGTFGGGLQYAKRKGDYFQFRKMKDLSRKQKFIHHLLRDHSGKVWVGGNNGIIVFDPTEILQYPNRYRHIHLDPTNPESLNENEVKCLFEDSRNQIWAGTGGGGLNLIVPDSTYSDFRVRHYTTEKGLANNVIQSIEEDDNGNLWVATENGVSKLNLESQEIESFNFSNNWENNLFCETSSSKRHDGNLMFGSFNGLYLFEPSIFVNTDKSFPVVLTKLLVNGIEMIPAEIGSPLSESITRTTTVQLNHRQNTFSIEFSSLNFQGKHSNRYTYILENYDKDWNSITQYNIATYKNVPPGRYVFKVKCVNSYGNLFEQETILHILIIPPFWKSSQAIILYILFIMVTLFFGAKLVVKMNDLHNAVIVEKQLTDYRLRFFTNVSHEFRTPLTIIRGSIENMKDLTSLPTSLKNHIHILEKSCTRLTRLVDQLLEFRKIQKGKMELNLEVTEIVHFFYDIYTLFIESAQRKNIDYTFTSNKEELRLLIDCEKMDKIAFNLLSNAFKHTPQGGKVSFQLHFDDVNNQWLLTVSDSGIGIPVEKRNMLFQRFAQINYTASGIGIGLNLVYELVIMHHGHIEYTDSEWNGAAFIITIPMQEIHSKGNIQSYTIDPPSLTSVNIVDIDTSVCLKDYKILIIEDDEEIQSFLSSQLENTFEVFTASDGNQGVLLAVQEQPNLIICDVMMPSMDGFEVTKYIKSDFNTSHIPIILLTAHSSIEHQVEGIEAGADAYIVKPFSTKYLLTRVVKLIEQREKLQQKYSHEPGLGVATISTTKKDKIFIEKINTIIDANIDNSEFNVEGFARALGIGRTMLYKKIKGITGYSPNEYIRVIRLKKAAELLITTELNISEIAYSVGFNDPFYFSRCFKKQFSKPPLKFRKQIEERFNPS